MKHLTYSKQMLIGILGLGVGHLLSWFTDISAFINLGWIFYGILFVVHPVWLENADRNPHIKQYVRIAGVVVILLGLTIHTGNSGDDFWDNRIEASLGVDVSEAVIATGYDDHSGFHGDGILYAVLEFSDDRFEEKISAPGGWNALPLTENLNTLIYGKWGKQVVTGPFIGVTVPQVEQGYWYFYDRQGMSSADDMVLNRGSFHYTIAIYDAARKCLYYCEYDT